MIETPRIEVTIAAPIEATWQALRERQTIRHWHGWDFDGLAEEIELIYFTQVTELPGERVLEVHGGDRFELTADGPRTKVRVTRVPRDRNPEWEAYYEDATEGWITFLHQLKFALERQSGAARRTLFYSSERLPAGLPAALGLADLGGLSPGDRYTATLAGEDVAGELFFTSANQLGVTVDGWGAGGPGLLVLATLPPLAQHPDGWAMAALSTYGLDDSRFDDLSRRWTAAWGELTPPEPATRAT